MTRMNKREYTIIPTFPHTEQCYVIYYKYAVMLLMFRGIMIKSANGMHEVYLFGSSSIMYRSSKVRSWDSQLRRKMHITLSKCRERCLDTALVRCCFLLYHFPCINIKLDAGSCDELPNSDLRQSILYRLHFPTALQRSRTRIDRKRVRDQNGLPGATKVLDDIY